MWNRYRTEPLMSIDTAGTAVVAALMLGLAGWAFVESTVPDTELQASYAHVQPVAAHTERPQHG